MNDNAFPERPEFLFYAIPVPVKGNQPIMTQVNPYHDPNECSIIFADPKIFSNFSKSIYSQIEANELYKINPIFRPAAKLLTNPQKNARHEFVEFAEKATQKPFPLYPFAPQIYPGLMHALDFFELNDVVSLLPNQNMLKWDLTLGLLALDAEFIPLQIHTAETEKLKVFSKEGMPPVLATEYMISKDMAHNFRQNFDQWQSTFPSHKFDGLS